MEKLSQEIAAQFERVHQRFSEMDQRFTEMDQRFTEMDQRFTEMDQRFTRLEQRLDVVDHRLDQLEANTSELRPMRQAIIEIDERTRKLEAAQSKQISLLETLAVRSVEHEAELRDLKRIK